MIGDGARTDPDLRRRRPSGCDICSRGEGRLRQAQMRWLPTLCALLICGSAHSIRAASSNSTESRNHSGSEVRSFPWMDTTYDFGDGNKMSFSKGTYADLDADGECNVCDRIRQIAFGDVDGDGREEALLVVSSNLGGAGTMICGYVFGLENGAPVLRATIEGGDRGDGGIESMKVQNGLVLVRRFGDENSGACCPNRIEVEKWAWTGTALEQRGKSTSMRRAPKPWFASGGNRAAGGRRSSGTSRLSGAAAR